MAITKLGLSVLLTLAIIYLVPFVVYSAFSSAGSVEIPEGSPVAFLLSVLVSKTGTAIAFVMIFHFAKNDLSGRWALYALIWWVMYVVGEVGQAIGPDYTWNEALAGIISETIYFPASAFVVNWLIKV